MSFPSTMSFWSDTPSFAELADAPVAEVKQTWYPLGYNIRPERLHSIARETVARYGGQLPSDADELLSFKGWTIHRRRNPLPSRSTRTRRFSIPT